MRADKSKNMYKINPSKYQEILRNKITDNYKIDYKDTICQINNNTCKFANCYGEICNHHRNSLNGNPVTRQRNTERHPGQNT